MEHISNDEFKIEIEDIKTDELKELSKSRHRQNDGEMIADKIVSALKSVKDVSKVKIPAPDGVKLNTLRYYAYQINSNPEVNYKCRVRALNEKFFFVFVK